MDNGAPCGWSGKQGERFDVTRTDGAEVAPIERGDGRDAQPLSRGNHRGVDGAERQIRVLRHELGDAQPVAGLHLQRGQVA